MGYIFPIHNSFNNNLAYHERGQKDESMEASPP